MNKKNIKIFHGPVNIAGKGGYLSEYQRRNGYISDFVVWNENKFFGNHDLCLHINKYPKFISIWILFFWFIISLLKYNIFHFYYGVSLIPFNLDLPLLKLFRKKVVMTYCGSDIRLMEIDRLRNPYWNILNDSNNVDNLKNDKKKKIKIRWHAIWIDKFTASRELYDYVKFIIPGKKIINDLWLNFPQIKYNGYQKNKIPVIVHAPSDEIFKGTKYIEKALKELEYEGYEFEYVKLENKNQDIVEKNIKKSDIVIDQLLIGSFGNLSLEGLANGKIVITFLSDIIKESYFPDIPIINANIDNIKDVIKDLLDNCDKWDELKNKGPKWIEKYFNIITINERVIKELYEIDDITH